VTDNNNNMSDLANRFIQLFRDLPFPSGDEFTEEAISFFQYGNDILLSYRGNSDTLIQATNAYLATKNHIYVRAGAANVLMSASYISGGKYDKNGIAEALRLIQSAKSFAYGQYELDYIEANVYNVMGNTQALKQCIENMSEYDEASRESSFARLQMRYYDNLGDLKKVRHWFEIGSKRAEEETEIRRISILSHMAGIIMDRVEFTDEAIVLYRKVVQLNANDPWAWHNLSLLYWRNKDYDKSGECNRRALDLMNFGAAQNITENLVKIWEKNRHKDPLNEYPRYLSSSTARSEIKSLNSLLTGKK